MTTLTAAEVQELMSTITKPFVAVAINPDGTADSSNELIIYPVDSHHVLIQYQHGLFTTEYLKTDVAFEGFFMVDWFDESVQSDSKACKCNIWVGCTCGAIKPYRIMVY